MIKTPAAKMLCMLLTLAFLLTPGAAQAGGRLRLWFRDGAVKG